MTSPEPTTTTSATPARTPPPLAERGVLIGGLRIASAMNNPPREMMVRAPLVVLPAAGYPWADYRVVLERFAGERRVYALDWPGFGGSATPAPTDYPYGDLAFAELLASWMDALGIARAVFLGSGLGGAVALRYAVAHPQRTLGLALVAPTGFSTPGPVRTVASRFLGRPELLRRVEPALTSLALGPSSELMPALVARHRAWRASATYDAGIKAAAALWRASGRPTADLAALARRVSAPAMVLRGALDPIISAAQTRRAVESLGARGGLEVVLPEAAHLPFLQQPERFAQALAGLLATADLAALQTS